jgi:geranylgeranyl diphosphate synthase type II
MTKSLSVYQKQIFSNIRDNLPTFGSKTKIRDACEYALTNGGKRIRPVIVFLVAEALGYHADVSQAALSIEYFHTASLVADDLPCMDDDDERRNKPSVHKAFGESAALLVSYALISAGYGCLEKNAKILGQSALSFSQQANARGLLALENAAFNTGLLGTTGGQFLDIDPPNLTSATLREVIHKKTVSLFEIAFVYGWLFGGGDQEKLPLVKKAASHFGTAFQIADDLDDLEQDAKNGRAVNAAAVFGVDAAKKMVQDEIQSYYDTLNELELNTAELHALTAEF